MDTIESTAATHGAVGAGWLGADLAGGAEWRVPVPADAAAELAEIGRGAGGRPLDLAEPAAPVSAGVRALAREAYRRLAGEPGFVVLTGFPVDDTDATVGALWAFGRLLGRPVSQSRKGDFVGRVENRGADIGSPTQRGYESAAALPFHADRTDVIGLLCVRPASEGGLSRLASARYVHDAALAADPDLWQELYQPLPHDRRGEELPGQAPWCAVPVFSRTDGRFAARYVRRFSEGSQRHPDAPRFTARQRAAFDLLDEVLASPGVVLDMHLRPGDLQLVNNFELLHARTAFRDEGGPGAGRLLLRLWLAFGGSPPLPESYLPLYGAVGAGTFRGGVWPSGVAVPDLGRPVPPP